MSSDRPCRPYHTGTMCLGRSNDVSLPKIVSHDEWVVAQKSFVVKEREATKQRDRLNTERRELPMVEVTTAYEFDGPDGKLSLLDLFEGRKHPVAQRPRG